MTELTNEFEELKRKLTEAGVSFEIVPNSPEREKSRKSYKEWLEKTTQRMKDDVILGIVDKEIRELLGDEKFKEFKKNKK